MAASVDFLEKMQELQEVHYESENKRLQLEQELNSFVKSDSRMAKLKAVRLQSYWKKICEDEKRSQWRNEQLLKDFDRVDSHVAELSARTERLKVMKKQYEEYIERMYPQWKEKVVFQKQQRDLAEKRAKEAALAIPVVHSTPKHGMPMQQNHTPPQPHYMQSPSSVSTGLSPSPQVSTIQAPPSATPSVQFPNSHSIQYAGEVARNAQLSNEVRLTESIVNSRIAQPQSQPQSQPQPQQSQLQPHEQQTSSPRTYFPGVSPIPGYRDEIMSPGQAPHHMDHLRPPSAGSTLQTISSLPSGTDLTSIQARALAAANQSADFSGVQTWESSDLESATGHATGYRPQEDSYLANQSSVLHTIESAEESVESPKQATVRPMKSPGGQSRTSITIPDGSGAEFDTMQTDPSTARSIGKAGISGDPELFDEDSLPLSGHGNVVAGQSLAKQPTAGPMRSRQNSQSSLLGDRSEDRSIYPEADITLEGLYNLIDAVQDAFNYTRQNKEFYRTDPAPPSVRNDIIENCNKGQMLTHVDPTSISMVVLEQLPLVVQNCEGGSLLPDSYLYKRYPETEYDTIRLTIHPASVRFFDRLCEHFVALVRFNIMNAQQVGEIFGPNLISEESPYEDKARDLLIGMLDGVEVMEPGSPASTATLSSLLTPKVTIPRPIPQEDVPPLDLPVSKSEDDDFFKQHKARNNNDTNPTSSLTQSAAYRQLLGTGMSTIQSADYEDSDDSDDVEKALTKSITSPRPKMTSTAKPGSTNVTAAGGEGGGTVAADIPSATKSSMEPDEPSSPDLSPPLSPAPAYVPSALTSTGKSTLSLSSTVAKKGPGFNFADDSDLDEDVDIGGSGTKSFKHGEEDDDFDFYG